MTHPLSHLPQGYELRSLVKADGTLELSLAETSLRPLEEDEICVEVLAAPINPSDIGLTLAGADVASLVRSGNGIGTVTVGKIPARALPALASRVGRSMQVGLEGAGRVIAWGNSPRARAMQGKMVALMPGGMYSHYRIAKADECLVFDEDTPAAEVASCLVNPLTALSFVETMRRLGCTGIVHTAAASNLGRMLNRICLAEGIGLVNIVRSAEQMSILSSEGATCICNSTSPDFEHELTEGIQATGATLAFDATGGGTLAGSILHAMEVAIGRSPRAYSRYGSTTMKHLYFYGALDPAAVEFRRTFGMAWTMGGWLLHTALEQFGPETRETLRRRIASEIRTTFKSSYVKEISMLGALDPEEAARFTARKTGGKYLVNPSIPLG